MKSQPGKISLEPCSKQPATTDGRGAKVIREFIIHKQPFPSLIHNANPSLLLNLGLSKVFD